MPRALAVTATVCVLSFAGPAGAAEAKTFVGCANASFSRAVAKVKPRTCTLLALRGTGLQLRGMRWSTWGGKTASGSGLGAGRKIRVKLYRRVRVGGGLCYTRASYRASFGSGRVAFATCGSARR